MSEAALCSAAGVPAATPLRSSTPQNPSSSPPQNHQCCVHSEDLILHHNLQRGNGSFEGTRSQLLPGTPQVDRTKTVGTLVMMGVVTGPARWRGSRVASGTPNLYCAVYKYSVTQCTLCSSDSSAQSSSEFPDSAFSSLPPPTLVSSTWGQGPLVIEGVPVLERHADTRIEGAEKGSSCRDDEIQSFFVSAYMQAAFPAILSRLPYHTARFQLNGACMCLLRHAGVDSGSFPQSHRL